MNRRRIQDGMFKHVSWLCTLAWKSKERKPFSSCILSHDAWNPLLDQFTQLDHDLDASLQTGPQASIKDIAKTLLLEQPEIEESVQPEIEESAKTLLLVQPEIEERRKWKTSDLEPIQ